MARRSEAILQSSALSQRTENLPVSIFVFSTGCGKDACRSSCPQATFSCSCWWQSRVVAGWRMWRITCHINDNDRFIPPRQTVPTVSTWPHRRIPSCRRYGHGNPCILWPRYKNHMMDFPASRTCFKGIFHSKPSCCFITAVNRGAEKDLGAWQILSEP